MSFDDDEIEQDDQDGAAGDGGGGGGAGGEEAYDGTADEAGVDSAFVVAGDKQPLSKGTVAMFVILALAGAGTYGMYVKSGTQTATAAPDPKAQAVIKEFMTQRDKNAQAMKKMLTDTDAVVRQFMNYRVEQIPLSGLVANPFRTAPANPGEPSRADEEAAKKKREEERVAILKAVNGLQLQSVMHSENRRSCMINNALYTEGQQVDAFLIEKIAPNCVIVRNGQYRFELRMQR
jgi:hypothetical protein